MVADITDTGFASAIARPGLVLFDLWSANCQPCRSLAPIFEDLAQDFAGEIAFCKGNISSSQALREGFDVRSVPTLALYRDGVEVDRIVGLRSRSQLTSWIESHL